ncbi:type I restriction enzyme, S subunit [Bathymodiolus platifrons methanotrophic gill symbiont]|uniref:restriction endonuclease subunit S n=1 Tax=unclassified Gammaproteobacteria TaxID=33811 RepID=UPI000B415126|nr:MULTISPECIES: restriction endonuclease subunit S [unclassified Gammaproteobacteria]GAW87485.1 type I restriction enzyme, S subunit [Bathymodiolus platifrons methanotrophic gill symbiont]GFO73552.1 type I restriction enzyme, S subunit [Bathymodiolus japonicus methanotrophic gill symbiont]GFO76991.1 type I restriction enzyme, S subunit [Bathymodiolus platifrons methanotrophic gill symbiont]
MSELPKGWIETEFGFLPTAWKPVEAQQFCAKVADGTHASPKKQESGKLLITSKNIKDSRLDVGSAYHISSEDYIKVNKRSKVNQWDVLLSMIGTVGEVCLIDVEPNFAIKNVGLFKCGDETKGKWLYYFLKSKSGQHYIYSRLSGTTQKYITLGELRNFPIPNPPLPEQKAVTNTLSVFDEKIELLREQNETLETLAQTIFKEWFINFNFPNATGEMVDSELGEIPKGWRVYELNELVDIVNGYSYKGKELVESSCEALVTLKSFNRNGGFQTRGFKPFLGNPKPQQEVSIGDLIVAHTDLTQDAEVLGNPAFVFEDGGFHKMFITMDLVKVNSKVENIENAFLYYVMKDRRFKGHCIGYSNGTTVLHLSKKSIPEYRLALPKDLILEKFFSGIAYSMTRKISNNISQIQTLTKTRDTLLPKLMSGKLRVKGFYS